MDLFNVVKSTKAVVDIPQSTNMVALNSDAIFQGIKERVAADPAKAKSVNGVFVYKITKDGKVVKEWSKLDSKPLKGLRSFEVQRLRKLLIMQLFDVLA